MIFIDLNNFSPTDDWLYEAWLINSDLLSKSTIEEKNRFIEENRDFWGKLKKELPSNDKCWYSESKESVSEYHIEHFRPIKATIRSKSVQKKLRTFVEAKRKDWTASRKYKGEGYWWLAFDYKNYRNCGSRINNIKGIRFPIKDNSFIAYSAIDNCNKEEVILLDPTNKADPGLLTFDPDGKARSTIADTDNFNYLRAFASIELYGLNAIEPLVKHRASKWSECYKAIQRATQKYSDLEEAVGDGNMSNFKKYFDEFMDFINNDIKPAIASSSEFSAVAKSCVLSYANYNWIKEYVIDEA